MNLESSSYSKKVLTTHEFKVEGMTCSNCSAAIEKAVITAYTDKGMIQVTVGLLTHDLKVQFDESITHSVTPPEEIVNLVESIGYDCTYVKSESSFTDSKGQKVESKILTKIFEVLPIKE